MTFIINGIKIKESDIPEIRNGWDLLEVLNNRDKMPWVKEAKNCNLPLDNKREV